MRVSRRIAAYSKPIGLLLIIALIFHFSSDVDQVKVFLKPPIVSGVQSDAKIRNLFSC